MTETPVSRLILNLGIPTTISMLNSMGDYAMAFALGMILIVISLVINSILYTYKEKRADV